MWPMWEAICDLALGWVPKAPKRESNLLTLVGRRGYKSCVLINVQIHFEWCVGLEFISYNILQSRLGSILDALRLDVWIKAVLKKSWVVVSAPTRCVRQDRWFQRFLFFSPQIGEMIQFDKQHIFQIGWFKHHPESHQHRPVLKVS